MALADKQSKLGFSRGQSKRAARVGCVRAISQQLAQSSRLFRSRESLGRELTAKLRYSRSKKGETDGAPKKTQKKKKRKQLKTQKKIQEKQLKKNQFC